MEAEFSKKMTQRLAEYEEYIENECRSLCCKRTKYW